MIRRGRGLAVGDVLHGFCGGIFGRDSDACKRVEAFGADWVIARGLHWGHTRGVHVAVGGRVLFDLVQYLRPDPEAEDPCCEYAARS